MQNSGGMDEEAENAYLQLINKMDNPATLQAFDVKRPTYVAADSSEQGMQDSIYQSIDADKWVPIDHTSRALHPESRITVLLNVKALPNHGPWSSSDTTLLELPLPLGETTHLYCQFTTTEEGRHCNRVLSGTKTTLPTQRQSPRPGIYYEAHARQENTV